MVVAISIRTGLRDASAGAICWILSAAYCLSFAALIFTGPLAPFLATGVSVTFLSAAVGAAIVAWRSSFPFAIGGPDNATSAVVAALVAGLMANMGATGHPLGAALILMALVTASTGLLLSGLGLSHAGRLVRFVPYPVIGGFMGATGVVMILGAVQVIADHRLNLGSVALFANSDTAAKLAAGAAVACVLEFLLLRSRNVLILPGVLAVAITAMHLLLWAKGIPVSEAQAHGWMFHPSPAAALSSPWTLSELQSFPWGALPHLAGEFLAVMFVATISVLLNGTGIEIATKREASVDRELKVVGLANLITGALGGLVSCLTLSRTILNREIGATGRVSGFTLAGLSAAMLVVDPAFLGYVPKFALGGLLFSTGGRLVLRWLVRSARRLLPLEYLSLLVIALMIINFGFVAGMAIGIVIGCFTFAFSASRVSVIKFGFDGTEYRSSLDRSADDLALLARHGGEIQGMSLQSYLFFGSASRLHENVKQLLATCQECRFLLFDFRLVTGLDSSASYSFSRIKDAADEVGAKLVLTGLSPELERAFKVAGFLTEEVIVTADLDHALEDCERAVILGHRPRHDDMASLEDWLAEALGDAGHAQALARVCIRRDVADGEIIARQGDAADSMHFILEGRIGVIAGEGGVRLRSLGRRTIIGEMGLIARRPRSATIQAERPSLLYELRLSEFDALQRDNPALSQALLAYVARVMAERLSFANRVIGILQR
ncbi:MAG: SulP family inorganic anion transporter [Alphaproteobacteria bacterium]|nr:SulP family inorganic anion transporter [Alphaproteobacteria bacterium]